MSTSENSYVKIMNLFQNLSIEIEKFLNKIRQEFFIKI